MRMMFDFVCRQSVWRVAEHGRRDARATLKRMASLAAVRGLCFVEETVHGFSSEQFVAQLEVIALPDLPGRKQPYDLDAGKCSISTSTASAVVADSF
jgi:hypothetical protein